MAKSHDKKLDEDAATNSAGGGAVAGIGVGASGEPGVHMGARRRKLQQDARVVDMIRRLLPRTK